MTFSCISITEWSKSGNPCWCDATIIWLTDLIKISSITPIIFLDKEKSYFVVQDPIQSHTASSCQVSLVSFHLNNSSVCLCFHDFDLFFVCMTILELELRDSCLLDRRSTTWATPTALFCARYFQERVSNFLPGLALKLDPPDLCLLSS
jgi:hypothetical protein